MLRRLALLTLALGCAPVDPQILSIDSLADTRDTAGPYVVRFTVAALDDDDFLEARYATAESGPFSFIPSSEGALDGQWSTSIPGQPAGTTVYYQATVRRGSRVVDETATASFQVLSPSGSCRVDTDCGEAEICAAGTCRSYSGACVDGLCPGGHDCDQEREPPLCVLAPHPCQDDLGCPVAEECDAERGFCAARPACLAQEDCPTGYSCEDRLGLCYRP
jgi:hypothetical protein